MNIKWIGIFCIVGSCGAFGIRMAYAHKCAVRSLQRLIAVLDYMACELHCRLTPLPDLCRQAAAQTEGELSKTILTLSEKLEDSISADVSACMEQTLASYPAIPKVTAECMRTLGKTLGRFDLDGQMEALRALREHARQQLHTLSAGKDERIRSYQTLGFCAGAALAILLL